MSTILAIDDQKDNLTTINAIIKNSLPECKILSALSGKEGIEIAISEQPDVILLDVIMPYMDGYEVCKRLKVDEATKNIPIVMITAIKTDSESRVKALNLGADAFLSKPINHTELTAQINVMLRIKSAEDKLRQKNDCLDELVRKKMKEVSFQSSVLSNVFNPIISFDLNYNITNWNKSAEELYGWKEKEVIGKDYNKVLKPDYRIHSREEIINILLSTGKYAGETVHLKKNGEQLNVMGSVSLIKDSNGKNIGITAIGHDITEQKMIQKALFENERRSQAWLENSPVCTKIVDLDFNLQYMSSYGVKGLGIDDITEYYGKPYPLCFFTDSFKVSMNKVLKKAKKTGKTIIHEDRIIDLKGNELWYYSTIVPVNDDKGQLDYIMVVSLNTTERVQLEKSLKHERDKFNFILNELPIGVSVTDADHKFVYINPISTKIDGYPLDSQNILGEHVSNVHPQKNQPIVEELLMDFKSGEKSVFTREAKRGNRSVEVSYHAVRDSKDKYMGLVRLVSDITERKKTENNLQTALKKATESDRLKSAFLATMSHELRTPLNAVIGFSDLIDEQTPIIEAINYGKIINQSGNHLLSIVEDIFDITLIEAGEVKLKKEDVKLDNLLQSVHQIIMLEQQKTKKDQLDLALKIPKAYKNLTINTDSSKLKQILLNLLKNALKFTNEGYISYGFEIKKIHDKSILKFYVEDTGIGISMDKREFIFDVFRQVDESKTKVYGGTGIGLSISKKLTELLGGEIWLESKKGKGSVFYFTIPLEGYEIQEEIMELDEKVQIDSVAIDTNEREQKTVLIVEDVYESSELLKILIEGDGYKTIWAKNGQEAVNFCNQNPTINLVLMDINMPVMNGFLATKAIKKFKPDLPIIAQTAYAIAGDREKLIEAGCDDYISKPIKKDELFKKINCLLKNS